MREERTKMPPPSTESSGRSTSASPAGTPRDLERERNLFHEMKIWCARRDSNAGPLAPEAVDGVHACSTHPHPEPSRGESARRHASHGRWGSRLKRRRRRRDAVEDAKLEKVKRIKPKRPSKKGTGKGALIKGMTKRLPFEILANPLFRVGLRRVMRGYAGIYALYHGSKLYYVGLTRNLFGRVRWHLTDRHARKWDSFVIFRIKRVNYVKDIETLLMQLIHDARQPQQGQGSARRRYQSGSSSHPSGGDDRDPQDCEGASLGAREQRRGRAMEMRRPRPPREPAEGQLRGHGAAD